MDRRSFLRRTSLALPALLVGDRALEWTVTAYDNLGVQRTARTTLPRWERYAPPGQVFLVDRRALERMIARMS